LALPKSKNKINKDVEIKYKLTYSKYKKSLIKKRVKSFIKKFLPRSAIALYKNIKTFRK